jgi:hypothetical protein
MLPTTDPESTKAAGAGGMAKKKKMNRRRGRVSKLQGKQVNRDLEFLNKAFVGWAEGLLRTGLCLRLVDRREGLAQVPSIQDKVI